MTLLYIIPLSTYAEYRNFFNTMKSCHFEWAIFWRIEKSFSCYISFIFNCQNILSIIVFCGYIDSGILNIKRFETGMTATSINYWSRLFITANVCHAGSCFLDTGISSIYHKRIIYRLRIIKPVWHYCILFHFQLMLNTGISIILWSLVTSE